MTVGDLHPAPRGKPQFLAGRRTLGTSPTERDQADIPLISPSMTAIGASRKWRASRLAAAHGTKADSDNPSIGML
jgi:hypothetical protein